MTRTDTIVAAATPPGRGGVGIVRVSGPGTLELATTLLGELPAPRRATFARFLDAQQDPIDAGLALFFPAPHSYTGEHVLELHGHGGPLVMSATFAFFPAGLVLYWVTNTVLSIAQQWNINRRIGALPAKKN